MTLCWRHEVAKPSAFDGVESLAGEYKANVLLWHAVALEMWHCQLYRLVRRSGSVEVVWLTHLFDSSLVAQAW